MKTRGDRRRGEIDEEVVVVPYDPAWPLAYASEGEALRSVPGVLGIEHFGSTSVPGLSAKPIVDILVGVQDLKLNAIQERSFTERGYEGFGEQAASGRIYFRKRGSIAFNLAVTIWNGPLWEDNILVRDYLRSHRQIAEAYAEQKQHAIAIGATRLLAYSESKAAFVQSLLQDARQWKLSGTL